MSLCCITWWFANLEAVLEKFLPSSVGSTITTIDATLSALRCLCAKVSDQGLLTSAFVWCHEKSLMMSSGTDSLVAKWLEHLSYSLEFYIWTSVLAFCVSFILHDFPHACVCFLHILYVGLLPLSQGYMVASFKILNCSLCVIVNSSLYQTLILIEQTLYRRSVYALICRLCGAKIYIAKITQRLDLDKWFQVSSSELKVNKYGQVCCC